jgi:hypothetical protein
MLRPPGWITRSHAEDGPNSRPASRARCERIGRAAREGRYAGAAAAGDIVVADIPGRDEQLVSAHPSQGTCGDDLPIIYRLGTLTPDARATIRVRTRATTASTMTNRAIVGSPHAKPG